jgi:hypothetical protein
MHARKRRQLLKYHMHADASLSRSSSLGTPLLLSLAISSPPPPPLASLVRFLLYRIRLPPLSSRHFLQRLPSVSVSRWACCPQIPPTATAPRPRPQICLCMKRKSRHHPPPPPPALDHDGQGHGNRNTMPSLGSRPYPRVAVLLHGHLHGKRSQKTAHDSGR